MNVVSIKTLGCVVNLAHQMRASDLNDVLMESGVCDIIEIDLSQLASERHRSHLRDENREMIRASLVAAQKLAQLGDQNANDALLEFVRLWVLRTSPLTFIEERLPTLKRSLRADGWRLEVDNWPSREFRKCHLALMKKHSPSVSTLNLAGSKNQPKQDISNRRSISFPDWLHPWVRDAAHSLWRDEHYRDAVRAAANAISAHTQSKMGRHDIADADLMNQVFTEKPKAGQKCLKLPGDPNDQTVKSRPSRHCGHHAAVTSAVRNRRPQRARRRPPCWPHPDRPCHLWQQCVSLMSFVHRYVVGVGSRCGCVIVHGYTEGNSME